MSQLTRQKRIAAACGGCLLGLLLATASGGPAPAANPDHAIPTPVFDALDAYMRQLGPKQQAQVAPLVQAADTNEQSRQGAMLAALCALNPDLDSALAALDDDRATDALPILDKLAVAPDPFLATHVAWFRARALVAGERFEDALASLAPVQTNAAQYSLLAGDLLYTEGVLHACLLDRPAARTILQRYLKDYPQAPPERLEAAREALDEIQRADPYSLSEIAAWLNDSRRRLQLQDCGENTLSRQAKLVEMFTAIIEKTEEKKSGGGKASKGTGQGGKPQKGKTGGQKPSKGAKESALSKGGAGKVDLSEPMRDNAPDDWARVYARERETVQNELQTRVPERYRDLVEQYYRSLSSEPRSETGPEEQQ